MNKKLIIITLGAILFVLAVGIITPKVVIKNPDLSSSPCAEAAFKAASKFPAWLIRTPKVNSFTISWIDMSYYTLFGIKTNKGIGVSCTLTKNADSPSKIFTGVPDQLLQKDSSVNLTPDPGYLITTSIKSHSGDKAVYAEISNCIGKLNIPNQYDPSACNWTYKVYVKPLTSGTAKQIYSYPLDPSPYFISLIPTAHAGGCPLVPFPIAWSKNDAKVILQWGVPVACGSGGIPKYYTFTINPGGGKLEGLATGDGIFFNDYQQVVYTDAGSKSPALCGPAGENNSGRIILKNAESGRSQVIAEEPNTLYDLKKINGTSLNFTSRESNKIMSDGCSDVDFSQPGQEKQININQFLQ